MPPRIVLVRHGRSAHVHRDGWIDAAGFARWLTAYDAAGIDPADAPPAALLADAERVGVVAASDAPRAVASARRLVGGAREVVVSPLLRETDLPVPRWVGGRLPLGGWALAIGVELMLGAVRGVRAPGAALERAAAAADLLAGLAAERGSVLAVTHGAFRRLLAARLASLGWRHAGGRRTVRTWSAWSLQAPEGDPPPAPR